MSITSTGIAPSQNVQPTTWPSASATTYGQTFIPSDTLSLSPTSSLPFQHPSTTLRSAADVSSEVAQKPHTSKKKGMSIYLAVGLACFGVTGFFFLGMPLLHELIAARQRQALFLAKTSPTNTFKKKVELMKSKHTQVVAHELTEKFNTEGKWSTPYLLARLRSSPSTGSEAEQLIRQRNEQHLLFTKALLPRVEDNYRLHDLVTWNQKLLKEKEKNPKLIVEELNTLLPDEKADHGIFMQWADEVYHSAYQASRMAVKL